MLTRVLLFGIEVVTNSMNSIESLINDESLCTRGLNQPSIKLEMFSVTVYTGNYWSDDHRVFVDFFEEI